MNKRIKVVRYIEGYAKKLKKSAVTACIEVLEQTEQVLNLILKGGANVLSPD